MLKRCLVCSAPFPDEQVLDHLPRGERVAYDAERGRLWLVCTACRRWSLIPLEARWEALEELERAVTDRGRVLSSTDRIALVKVGPLEVVRVGGANRTEEAWWRYGRELVTRRRKYTKLSTVAAVGTGAVLVGGWATGGVGMFGAWMLWNHAPDGIKKGARWLRFGSTAWRGEATCRECGHRLVKVPFKESGRLFLVPGDGGAGAGPAQVVYRCPRCARHDAGGIALPTDAGERVLKRVLAHKHFAGATERRVKSATRLIEEAGSPGQLTRILVKGGRRLDDLQRTGAIALEIAANESSEERLLELELSELEAVWRQEEELARIIDGELTPLPLLEQLRRKVSGHIS
jgi:hypothetical protein